MIISHVSTVVTYKCVKKVAEFHSDIENVMTFPGQIASSYGVINKNRSQMLSKFINLINGF